MLRAMQRAIEAIERGVVSPVGIAPARNEPSSCGVTEPG
jgi:hypothetical protein